MKERKKSNYWGGGGWREALCIINSVTEFISLALAGKSNDIRKSFCLVAISQLIQAYCLSKFFFPIFLLLNTFFNTMVISTIKTLQKYTINTAI